MSKEHARVAAHATRHAVDRLRERFPQFKDLPRKKRVKILELAAFLGTKLRRSNKWIHGKGCLFVRANNLFGTGADMVTVCIKDPNYEKYILTTVVSHDHWLENRRDWKHRRNRREDQARHSKQRRARKSRGYIPPHKRNDQYND